MPTVEALRSLRYPPTRSRGVQNFQRNREEHKPPSIHVHVSMLQVKLIGPRLILDILCLLGLEDNGNEEST